MKTKGVVAVGPQYNKKVRLDVILLRVFHQNKSTNIGRNILLTFRLSVKFPT